MLVRSLPIIIWACLCHWLFCQAFASPLSFIQVHNIEIAGYVIICYLSLCDRPSPIRLLLLWFVISHTILMFYAFLPDYIRTAPIGASKTYVDLIKEWFYYIWIMLGIFTLIVYKHKKLA